MWCLIMRSLIAPLPYGMVQSKAPGSLTLAKFSKFVHKIHATYGTKFDTCTCVSHWDSTYF